MTIKDKKFDDTAKRLGVSSIFLSDLFAEVARKLDFIYADEPMDGDETELFSEVIKEWLDEYYANV
jgi:hypothetical protein